MDVRQGLLPHDPAAAAAVPALFGFVPPSEPPDRLSRAGVDYTPRFGDNATLPDCTGESLRECATAQAAVLGGYVLDVAPDAARRFYAACIDQPDADMAQLAATDGADMLTVAARQMAPGFATGADTLHGLYGRIPTGTRYVAMAAARFGLVQGAITLRQRDMDDMFGADRLDDDGSDPGAVVGGHAVGLAWEWTGLGDADEFVVVTYGLCKPATWRWLRARVQIALAYRWRQLDPAGMAEVDEAGLDAALRGMVVV